MFAKICWRMTSETAYARFKAAALRSSSPTISSTGIGSGMPALIGTMMIFSESRGLKKRCGESADRRGSLRDGSNPKSNMKSTIGAPISASSSNASVRDAAKKRCFTDPLRYVTGFQAGSTQSRKNRARQRGAVRFLCCIHKNGPRENGLWFAYGNSLLVPCFIPYTQKARVRLEALSASEVSRRR